MPRGRLYLLIRRAVLLGTCISAACGNGSSPVDSGDSGADGEDAAGFVPAPDLRFKWVASGFHLDLRFGTNVGVGGTPGIYTAEGFDVATPLVLTGDSASHYSFFGTDQKLEPMVAVAASHSSSRLGSDLDLLLTEHSIIDSLDCSPESRAPVARMGGAYFVIL